MNRFPMWLLGVGAWMIACQGGGAIPGGPGPGVVPDPGPADSRPQDPPPRDLPRPDESGEGAGPVPDLPGNDEDVPGEVPVGDPGDPGPEGPGDSGVETGGDVPEADVACTPEDPFDYICDPRVPATCPRGICVLSMCIAPVRDPDRWAGCSDGTCDPCEPTCPADCGPVPEVAPGNADDPEATLTVWLHGFYNKSADEMRRMVYGKDRGCGGLLRDLRDFGVQRPCSDEPGGALRPDQMTSVEYYGGTPASWMTPADVAEIERFSYDSPDAIHRYALVAARFIRWKMAATGARQVQIACHSMGCYVTRYLLENDLDGLASEGKVVRWFTSAGVIAGARLARLYDNPSVQNVASAVGLMLSDFVVLNPDFVQERAAAWDHRLWEGNSPLLRGIRIHHLGGTDPFLREALNIPLLDLNNPGDEPNDGIMYTEDEYFHRQGSPGGVTLSSGRHVEASHSLVREYHMQVPETRTAAMMAAAHLFHHRRVTVRLAEVLIRKDRESHSLFDGEHGSAPAEVTWAVEVRYNPYVQTTFGEDILAHEDRPEHRTAPLWTQKANTTVRPEKVVFERPVFDGMEELRLDFQLLEADWYPRYNVKEWQFDIHQALVAWRGQMPIRDHEIVADSEHARARLVVEVTDLYR